MKTPKRVLTRRDFIRAGSCAAMGSLMGFPVIGASAAKTREKSRVVLIRHPDALDSLGTPKNNVLEELLDESVAALLGAPDAASAWHRIFRADDAVGIKSNEWAALATPEGLEKHIRKRLETVGIKPENISVDDRGVRRNPIFQKATALINIRPMRTHHWSGLGTLIKNYIMFVPQPWMYHGNACERLGAVWKQPLVEGKTRLNVLVMLTPLFHGIGPHHFSRQYLWPYKGLIVGFDPVAADAVGARIIQAKRDHYFKKPSPISPPPRHIEAADTQFDLGNSRPDRIELLRLGWNSDMLI